MKNLITVFTALFFCLSASAAVDSSRVNVLSYSGTNVTTAAYTLLVSSSPMSVSRLQVCDTSTKLLKIASGASGSEVDLFTVSVSGCVIVPIYLVAGTRLSIKAIDATASSGYNSLAFLQ